MPAFRDIFIDVDTELRAHVNGLAIEQALTVAELHELVGMPTRSAEPRVKPPMKNRNNQVHVYDNAGVLFNEHHYTRRIQGCSIVLWPEVQADVMNFPWAPKTAYSSGLRIAGYNVPANALLQDFLLGCSIPFEERFGGWWRAAKAENTIIITTRRSRTNLQIVSIELSWPHDPWQKPPDTPPQGP